MSLIPPQSLNGVPCDIWAGEGLKTRLRQFAGKEGDPVPALTLGAFQAGGR